MEHKKVMRPKGQARCSIPTKQIVIFGGARGMGLWVAQFLQRHRQKVIIADPYDKTPEIAKKYCLEFLRLADDYPARVTAHKKTFKCDVLIMAVPITTVPEVAYLVGPLLSPGSLLMDVTSLKTQAMLAMESAVTKNVGVLGTHPMFAPRVPNFFAQTCVVVPSSTHPPGKWVEWWELLVHQENGVIVTSTAEEHDEMMLIIQVLLHFIIMSFATTIKARQLAMDKLYRFKSPVWETATALLARLFSGNPGLYYSIQQHPNGKIIRELFSKASGRIAKVLANGGFEKFLAFFEEIRMAVGKSNITAYSSTASALFANLATHKKEIIESKGSVRCVLNIESGKIHYGMIKEITADSIILKDGKRCVTLSFKKTALLGTAEENAWKLQHLPKQKKSFSFFIPNTATVETFKTLIAERLGVAEVHIADIYEGPGVPPGFKKVTILVKAIRDSSGDLALVDIESILRGLGCFHKQN